MFRRVVVFLFVVQAQLPFYALADAHALPKASSVTHALSLCSLHPSIQVKASVQGYFLQSRSDILPIPSRPRVFGRLYIDRQSVSKKHARFLMLVRNLGTLVRVIRDKRHLGWATSQGLLVCAAKKNSRPAAPAFVVRSMLLREDYSAASMWPQSFHAG